MVTSKEENLVYDIKLSSVGPGQVTGSDVVHELSNMDLAMKLHYLRGVYFFNSRAVVQGLTNMFIKESTFSWLNLYYNTSGRFRRSESGRPLIKCNDCGMRFIEAKCDKTIDEWLQMKDASLLKLLASHQVIGPELSFSPPTLMQVTRFKCGGIALGLSWAHVLGDPFSCVDFFNMWGKVVAGLQPSSLPNITKAHIKIQESENPQPVFQEPLSIKWVDPVGDLWITANNIKMDTFSFSLTSTQLAYLESKVLGPMDQIPTFEILCAVIWQCVAKIRVESEPKVVTVCKKDVGNRITGILSNNQIVSTVKADCSILNADLKKLAMLLVEQAVDERNIIEEAMERDHGVSDCIMYGANLTFVNLEDTDLYGIEFNGQKPIFVNYTVQGVGDEGTVLVLPGPKDFSGDGAGGDEILILTIILPENQVLDLKSELKVNWGIA